MPCLNSCRKLTLGFVAGVLALSAGLYVAFSGRSPTHETIDAKSIPPAAIDAFFAARLPDPLGAPKALGDWRGKTLVVNFWASWCQPCREEMPAFSRLQTQYANQGVQFVGIAVDNAKNVAEFSAKLPVSYPLLITEAEGGEWMRQLGNSRMGLPYTLVIKASGEVGLVRLGRLSESMLEEYLKSHVIPSVAGHSGQRPAN